MQENIEKILERIKGKEVTVAKTKIFKMVLEITGLRTIDEYVIVELYLREYTLVAEHQNKEILINGAIEFDTDSIINIHNAAIRNAIRNVVKHYGVELFAYELKNFISSPR